MTLNHLVESSHTIVAPGIYGFRQYQCQRYILRNSVNYSVRHSTAELIYLLHFQEHYVNLQILIRQEQKTKVDVPCEL